MAEAEQGSPTEVTAELKDPARGLPLGAAEVLTGELAAQVAQSGGFRRVLRGFFTAVPMLITGGIGLALLRPDWWAAANLPASPAGQEVAAKIPLAGGALFAAGAGAVLLLLLPWATGRLLAAGSSYLLGLTLVLYLLAGAVFIFVDGDFETGWIVLGLALLCAWAPGQAIGFSRGELQRVQLRAMLAAGSAAAEVGVDRPGGWKRWLVRFLVALPVLGTGIALLLWLGSVRGKPAVRCVCLGAQAFLAYLVAVTAAQVALIPLSGMGTYYPGGGAGPVSLDDAVLKPGLWVLVAWCVLSAGLAVRLIAGEVRGAGANDG